jgi:alpha-D-xyloside xylohydrolase
MISRIGNPLHLTLLLLLTMIGFDSFSQNYETSGNGIKYTVNGIDVRIQFYTPDIVRVIKTPAGRSFKKESFSVIKHAQAKMSLDIDDKGDLVNINSGKVIVSLNKRSGTITYSSSAGSVLLNEKEGGSKFTPFIDAGESTFTVEQSFVLDTKEAIYGLGQQQGGKMVQRNLSLNMVQDNTSDYVTFFQSVKGYCIFWDNYSPTFFSDTPEVTSFRSDVGDCIDYYFMFGGNADGVISCMRSLTGQVPMFPLWTYGYWQSKERYKSQDELVGVVKKYRALGVPLDGIIQDWQYWGNNYLWNAMEFLNPEFHDPRKMVDEVHSLNAHIIISIWNSFGPQTKQYRELNKINALMDFKTWPESGSEKFPPNADYPSGVKVYDPYNPDARDIYWKYLNAGLFSVGIDGWWIDSSEPDHMSFKESDLDNKTYFGSFRKVRNAFPLMTVGGVYDHQRAANSEKRVFILTRSAFAGQQRYGSNTWSGDVSASWNALRNQISAGLNFSLCGIPYWNSDIGGFFLWEFPGKLNDPDYRELYVRWLQFGTFCPMMRSHGTDAPREIYQFGNKGEKHYDAIEKFIRLRYRLLPYIYSTAWDVTSNQSTMMRALMMDFPNDKNAWDINDEFMLGKSILVSPVTQPMYIKHEKDGKVEKKTEDFSIVKTKETYLPAGANWVDFWTGETLSGGAKVKRETPLDIIPLYVKAGSVIPVGPEVQYAEEKKWDNLEIRIYPGADGKFVLYEDENDNYNYEQGQYATITFTWDDKKKMLTIGERRGSFPGMLENRKFNVVIAGKDNSVGEKSMSGKSVAYAGRKINVSGL